jgi:hypothetical protein
MSFECEKCGQHCLDCWCHDLRKKPIQLFTEEDLHKLFFNIVLDFFFWKVKIDTINEEDALTIADVDEFCKAWAMQNVKSFDASTGSCEGDRNLKNMK